MDRTLADQAAKKLAAVGHALGQARRFCEDDANADTVQQIVDASGAAEVAACIPPGGLGGAAPTPKPQAPQASPSETAGEDPQP